MPLHEGKSKKAFKQNVKAEINAGKPPKQAVAIAYSVRRKKMSKGGEVKQPQPSPTPQPEGPISKEEAEKFKKGLGMGYYEGGEVEDCEESSNAIEQDDDFLDGNEQEEKPNRAKELVRKMRMNRLINR